MLNIVGIASVEEMLADYLKDNHKSEEQAIKGKDLRRLFNLQDRQLRVVVSNLRQKGEPICSSSNGYWYSKKRQDLDKTIRRMDAQIFNMERSLAGLQRNLQEAKDE